MHPVNFTFGATVKVRQRGLHKFKGAWVGKFGYLAGILLQRIRGDRSS